MSSMNSSSIDQQFVEYIVKSLVSNPDEVIVERRIDEKGVLLELTVDPEDLGRVIGKRGATAQSLRTLLRALGTKNDARYNLKIVDNGVGGPSNSSDDSSASNTGSNSSTNAGDEAADTSSRGSASRTDDDDADEVSQEDGDSSAESTRVSKTRQELQELDDLDV
jgi:predicted RNA-binding protein YlqC (UPF0109 family)